MEILLAIIFIIFGILQIILFFKLWGMTNDISTLKNQFEVDRLSHRAAKIAYLKGDKEKAQSIIDDLFLAELCRSNNTQFTYPECYKRAIDTHQSFCEKFNLKELDYNKYKEYENLF